MPGKTNVRLLYIQCRSDSNAIPRYGTYEGRITDDEKALLEFNENASKPFRPHFDHGAHSDYALLSYFDHKYPPPSWEEGDPENTEHLEDSLFPELEAEFVSIHTAYLAKHWDHIIRFGYIEPLGECLSDVLESYIDHLVEKLEDHGNTLSAEQRTLVQNLPKILALKVEDRDRSPTRNTKE